MTFGFIISVYVGILVLALLVRGRHSGEDFVDDTVDEAIEVETQPGLYDATIAQRERAYKEDAVHDGDLHGIYP